MRKKIQNLVKSTLAITLSAAMIASSFSTIPVSAYGNIDPTVYSQGAEVAKKIESEGIVLLKNEKQALPLTSEEKINVFGCGSLDPFLGGGGSGAIKSDDPIDFYDGLNAAGINYNKELYNTYSTWYEAHKEDGTGEGTGGATGQLVIDVARREMPATELTKEVMDQAKAFSETAVVVISRSGSESSDVKEEYLALQANEKAMVEAVATTFDKVIVLFNICNVLEMGWLEEYPSIQAAAVIWAPGEVGMESVGAMLTGKVNPSGRLADTIAYDVSSHPSSKNFGNYQYTSNGEAINKYFVEYEEGIYVGYRYFETFGKDNEVQYPFGYGLSYTTFDWNVGTMEVKDGQISVDVNVTNTGDRAGKEVVQLYYSAPYTNGGLEKSSIVLGGYEKTKELAPGASETVTVTMKVDDMASYSTQEEAYLLEKGTYTIKVAKDVKDIVKEQTYELSETKTIKNDATTGTEIKNLFQDADDQLGTVLSRAEGKTEETYPTSPENYVASDAVVNSDTLPEVVQGEAPKTGVVYEDGVITLSDVAKDNSLWEKFLDQLTVEEMIYLVGDCGYKTAGLERLGIPATLDNDGPASVKGTNGYNYTDSGVSYPVETVLACTWNDELAEEMGVAAGKDAADLGVNVWYAPATNTHRSPMGGRNFEYYSEDPLLAGKMSAAVTRGAQSQNLVVTVKHFALNDQETNRDANGVYTWANEQAMREIYLKSFEIAVKEGGAYGIMSSFNRIGTNWAGGSKALLTDLLRTEWGFNGFVVTDFYQNYTGTGYMDPCLAVYAQNDALLSGIWAYQERVIVKTMKDRYAADPVGFGQALRQCAKNLCTMKMQTKAFVEEADKVVNATYTMNVEGYDWGPAVNKITVKSDAAIDAKNITTENFTVYVNKSEFSWATMQSQIVKKPVEALACYASDKDGNKVTDATSNYVTFELKVGPSYTETSPFTYTFSTGFNTWTDPYGFTVELNHAIVAGGEKIDAINITACDAVKKAVADEFEKGTYTFKKDGITLEYASFAPEKDSKKNSLIIWLHGAGEGGQDPNIALLGNKVVNLASDEIQSYFDGAYVLAPQAPTMWMDSTGEGTYTSDGSTIYTESLKALIDHYVAGNPDIDTNRIYIGGCSNGGFMTMKMILTYPEYFTAAYPVCEAYTDEWITDEQLKAIKDLPIWFTFADNDTTVNPKTCSLATYTRLIAAGAKNVVKSEFADVHDLSGLYTDSEGKPYQYMGHWSWIYTLNNDCKEEVNGKTITIMEWLASQKQEQEIVTPTVAPTVKPTTKPTVTPTTKPTAQPTVVKFPKSSITLEVGQSTKVAAKVTTSSSNKKVLYTSSKAAVAVVNPKSGTIVAKGAGIATITATALDGSNATATYTVKVRPKKVTVSLAKSLKKNTATIAWKKQAGVTGYQIYMSTKSKASGTFKKVKTITSKSTTRYTVTKLAGGKKVYFKVRAYKIYGNTKIYGAFSSVKTVTVKKK